MPKLSDPQVSSQDSLEFEDHINDEVVPLLISVVDENVNKLDDNQWYLTKNIHYIFTDDEEDQEDFEDQDYKDEEKSVEIERFQSKNEPDISVESETPKLFSKPALTSDPSSRESVIVVDVDKHFRLQNAELISDNYRLLDCSAIQKTRPFDVSRNLSATTSREKSNTLQISLESTDIKLTVLSKFCHDPHIAETHSLSELITIYKKQNEQLFNLLDTLE